MLSKITGLGTALVIGGLTLGLALDSYYSGKLLLR